MDSLDEPRHDKVLYQLESSREYFTSNDVMLVEIPEEYRKPGETAFQLASVNFENPKLSWNFPADKILRTMAGIKVPEDEEKRVVPNAQSGKSNFDAIPKIVSQIATNEMRTNWRNMSNFPYNHKRQNPQNFIYAPIQQPDWMPSEGPSSSSAALKPSLFVTPEQRWSTPATQPSANRWPSDRNQDLEGSWQPGRMYPQPQQSRNIQPEVDRKPLFIPPPSGEWQFSEGWSPPEAHPTTDQWQHEETEAQNEDWQSSEVVPHILSQIHPPMSRQQSGRRFRNKWSHARRSFHSQNGRSRMRSQSLRGYHNHSGWDASRTMESSNTAETRAQDKQVILPPEPRHFNRTSPLQQDRHFCEVVPEGAGEFNRGRGRFYSRNFNNQTRFPRNRFQRWRR